MQIREPRFVLKEGIQAILSGGESEVLIVTVVALLDRFRHVAQSFELDSAKCQNVVRMRRKSAANFVERMSHRTIYLAPYTFAQEQQIDVLQSIVWWICHVSGLF